MATCNTDHAERQPRLPANDRVLIHGLHDEAWMVNWSARGFCALTADEVTQGQQLKVEFPERYARGEATVVWAQQFPDGCVAGFRFLSLDRRAVSKEWSPA